VRWIVAFFIFLSVHLFANESEPLFVSLGRNCHPALYLRDCGLRKAAYPFDWLITLDFKGFIKILDDDFAFFVTDEYLIPDPLTQMVVVNDYYHIYFAHEGPFGDTWDEERFSQQVLGIKDKFVRRINRFRELREYRGKVFFLCEFWSEPCVGAEVNENSNYALALRDALDRYFPALDYTLVIISYTDLNIPALLSIERVVEYQMDRSNQHVQQMFDSLLNAALD